jgi:endonuclease G
MDGHARLRIGSSSRDVITWSSKQQHRFEDVLEVWFKPADDLRFRVVDPNRAVTPWVERSSPLAQGVLSTGNRFELSLVRYHVDNGDSRLVVTVSPGLASSIEPGAWTLEIESRDVPSGGRIDAWLERIDTRPTAFTTHQDEEMTLSIPATARTVIAVAAVQKTTPFDLFDRSSYGPTRDQREKPDLSAPGAGIIAALAGTASDVDPQSGTSMACPHVAGSVALLLSRRQKQIQQNKSLKQLSAAQVRAALRESTQNAGTWVPGMGCGVLDTTTFVSSFD